MDVAAALRAGRVRLRQEDVDLSVATTGTPVLPPNPNRVAFAISNPGTNFVMVAHRPLSAATRGVRLDSAGGYYSEKYEELGAAVGSGIYAAADTAAVTVSVTEWEVY